MTTSAGDECDYCGASPAPVIVDDPLGLAVWNHLHPDDQRTELHLCSEMHCYMLGLKNGELLARTAGSG